jgi:hypothetical protein
MITLRRKPPVSLDVVCRLGVLSTVDFDNQSMFLAHEIDDELPYRDLPAEAEAVEAMRP